MHLQYLHLSNFKNYQEIKLDLSSKINVLVGKNGSGKTNILDSIYFLSMTKSAITSQDNYCIRHGEQFFFIRGIFNVNGKISDVSCAVQSAAKKIVREDANEYQRVSEHIGKYPVVLIAPDDTELVKEGSEPRRKFFDSIISQLDNHYLDTLIQYNHVLKQRNGLLKLFAENKIFDAIALDSYDEVLIRLGNTIYNRRSDFVQEYTGVFQKYYQLIVEEEKAELDYASELRTISFEEGLKKNRHKDLALQRSSFGIHRDDYLFTFTGGDLKRLGSQGQQKSFVIALKLAQFEILEHHKGFKPILLLDDIFDKLDDFRIARLLRLIKNDQLGQLFITDARPDRTAGLLKDIQVPVSIYKVEHGSLINLDKTGDEKQE